MRLRWDAMVSITLLQLASNLFALAFFFFFLLSFYFVFVSFLFFLVGLEYYTLKSLEHFSFNSVRWGGSWYFRPSSRGGLANFTPIAGMGHLISGPKFKIPTSPPPLLISDKSLPWGESQITKAVVKVELKRWNTVDLLHKETAETVVGSCSFYWKAKNILVSVEGGNNSIVFKTFDSE